MMLNAELRKITTTRAAPALAVGAIAVVALVAFSTTASAEPAALRQPVHTQQMFLLASINIGLFAAILGIRNFTDEFRHNTVAWTLLCTRNRWRIVAAKVAVSATAAAAMAAAAQLVMVAIASTVASGKGAGLGLSAGADVGAAAGLVLSAAAWATIGVGVGVVIRHQVAAVVGAVIWVFVVENLAAGLLRGAAALLPGQAAHSTARAIAAAHLLDRPAGAAILAVYAALAAAAGAVVLTRRELAVD